MKSKALAARLNKALRGDWAGKALHGVLPEEDVPSVGLAILNHIDAAA